MDSSKDVSPMSPVFLSPTRDHFSIVLVLILLPVNMQFKAFRGSDARHTHRGNLEYSKILHGVWERGCGHQIPGFRSGELPCLEPHSLENQVAIHPSCWDWIRTPWGVAQELAGKQSMLSLEYTLNFWKVPTGRGTAGTESSRLWRISLENSRGIKV